MPIVNKEKVNSVIELKRSLNYLVDRVPADAAVNKNSYIETLNISSLKSFLDVYLKQFSLLIATINLNTEAVKLSKKAILSPDLKVLILRVTV